MIKTTEEYKQDIIDASKIAVEELIKVLEAPIIVDGVIMIEEDGLSEKKKSKDELTADRMKSAVQAKKIACFDAFEILTRIDAEQISLTNPEDKDKGHGFAEGRAR